MNKYEAMYIIDSSIEEQAIKDLIEKFSSLVTSNGGVVESVNEWGKRRLAYAIDYKTEGYYVLMNFESNPDLPKELERNMHIQENVIRYMIIRLDAE